MQFLRANTQVKVVVGPVVAVGNGYVPVTSLSLSGADEAELMKHDASSVTDISGATFAAITSADGYYNLTLTTSHTDTEGLLTVLINDDSLCLPVKQTFMVLAEAAWDSMVVAKDDGFMDVNIKTVGRADTQETEASNLEAACAAYSATRGLTGTAVPAVAAGGAGGLPTDSTGKTSFNDIAATAIVSSGAITTSGGAVSTVTNLTNAPTSGDLTATMKASVNTEVLDVLNTDTFTEPGQGTPAATNTLVAKIGYLFKAWRNRTTQTSSEYALYADDGTTKDQEAAVSDDGTTYDRGEVGTGA